MTEGLRPALTTHAPNAPPAPWGAPWGAPWRDNNRSLARHGPRAWLIGFLLLAFMTAVPAADVMPYDLTLKPTGNAAMDQALLDASLLASLGIRVTLCDARENAADPSRLVPLLPPGTLPEAGRSLPVRVVHADHGFPIK